ncbi:MBL fold metallo-hydrolase [Candidatus Falkowbacteria bacterium]|nr:MBL fold metallo-hydrolase [Candidatus Falkowbacteria bacterium]
MMTRKRLALILASFFLLAATCVALPLLFDKTPRARVTFLNVGQGDAVLIQTSGGQRVLIDAGPDGSVGAELARALPFWADSLDAVIITHAHADHYGGLPTILKRFKVGWLIYGQSSLTDGSVGAINEAAVSGGSRVGTVATSKKMNVGHCLLELGGLPETQDRNDQSLVGRLKCDDESWMFLGDLSAEHQSDLIRKHPDWRSDIVKISHHGSDDGLNEELLKAVGAKYAVISVGKENKFGHPSLRSLKKLERLGVQVFRTDIGGAINVLVDKGKTVLNYAGKDLLIK